MIAQPLTRITALGATGLLAAGLLGVVANPAYAATLPVDSSAGLVAAITLANSDPNPDTIEITGSFVLAEDLPEITEDLIILGNGNSIAAAGYESFSFGSVDEAEIHNLTITDALDSGIYALHTNLVLENVTVTGSGDYGLSVDFGSLSITGSTFSDNRFGGASIIANTADITISASHFDDNDGFEGLLIIADSGAVTVTGTTANDNEGNGARFVVEGDTQLVLTGVEASGNEYEGFEIEALDSADVRLTDLTADDNGDNGIDLHLESSSALTATGLSANDNGDNGFEISTDGDVVGQISDSVFDDNRDNGVDVEARGGELTFTRVDTSGNGDSGYLLSLSDAGRVVIAEANIDGNTDSGIDADIYGSVLDVLGSTISRNTVGAIFYAEEGSLVSIVNSTVSGNEPGTIQSVFVGGILFDGNASGEVPQAVIANSTITDNFSGYQATPGGVGVIAFALRIENSILAGNGDWSLATQGLPAQIVVEHSLLHNAFGDPIVDAAIAAGTGNITDEDPLLGPLANNGGHTLTQLPQAGSPVIDAGDPAFAGPPTQDQRGQARVQNGRLDMGAVETQVPGGGGEGGDEDGDGGLADSGGPDILVPGLVIAGLLVILGAVLLFVRTRRRRS